MKIDLIVLAKSDKHNGYCVAGISKFGKFVRLVRDSEGHALEKERCKFKKLDFLTAEVSYTPLKHQKENFTLRKILNSSKSMVSHDSLKPLLQNSQFIFSNTDPYLCENEMNKQKSSFLLVEVNDLHIYRNDEKKYKADFTYNNQNYKRFSVTDPEFKLHRRKISKAIILISLPNTPYNKYGKNLYYKFICAIYPNEKSHVFDCYKI